MTLSYWWGTLLSENAKWYNLCSWVRRPLTTAAACVSLVIIVRFSQGQLVAASRSIPTVDTLTVRWQLEKHSLHLGECKCVCSVTVPCLERDCECGNCFLNAVKNMWLALYWNLTVRVMCIGPEVSWGWWNGSFELRLLNGLIHDSRICVIEAAVVHVASGKYCCVCVCVCCVCVCACKNLAGVKIIVPQSALYRSGEHLWDAVQHLQLRFGVVQWSLCCVPNNGVSSV